MKAGLVWLATALLAVVVTGSVSAQSRTEQEQDFFFGRGRYRYSRYYGDRYSRYYRDGYYRDGYTAPLAVLGASAAAALGGGTPYIVGAAALGWLVGQEWDRLAVQRPVEQMVWSEDSEGHRSWQKVGTQTKVGRPNWVGQPTAAPATVAPVTVAPVTVEQRARPSRVVPKACWPGSVPRTTPPADWTAIPLPPTLDSAAARLNSAITRLNSAVARLDSAITLPTTAPPDSAAVQLKR